MTKKALVRHKKQHDDSNRQTFTCDICGVVRTRKETLLDHQRRIHLEPSTMGRPRKKQRAPPRKRSPFRLSEFKRRHGTTINMLKENSETKTDMEKEINAINEKLQKHLERLEKLEQLKKREENEHVKIKSRVIRAPK